MIAARTGILLIITGALALGFSPGSRARSTDSTRSLQTADASSQRTALQPFAGIQWRGVSSPDGTYGGTVSDVLVDLPSGRILSLVVRRDEPYRYPKVVPASAVTRLSDGTFRCQLTLSQWLALPILDATGTRLENLSKGRVDYVGFAEPLWTVPRPTLTHGLSVVPPPPANAPAQRFVSLERLRNMPVDNMQRQELGTIRTYLVDWNDRRVTHVVLAAPRTDDPSIAVPVTRLMPRLAQGVTLFVNTDLSAVQRAPQLSLVQATRQRDALFRYKPATLVTSRDGSAHSN
jgi:sporulation protein YlmC with PRC-barrel domain